MKRLALLVAALLLVTPAADARKKHKRHRLHGQVSHVQAKAPASWSYVPPAPTPSATPASAPTPTVTPSASPTATPTSTLPPPNTHSVSVRSTEFQFTLSQATVDAGDVRVQFDNSRAEDPHSLSIDGPDPDYWSFDQQDPGTVTQRTLTLKPGSYVLFCPLLDHEARGMRAVLTVR